MICCKTIGNKGKDIYVLIWLSGTREGKETPRVYLIIFTWVYIAFLINQIQ